MKKRRFLRFDVPGRAYVKFDSSQEPAILARTANFSREGISIEINEKYYSEKDSVSMDILPGWEASQKVSLKGHVVWRNKSQGCCRMGICIDEMDKSEKNSLLEGSYSLWHAFSLLRK